ncbi:hypothetical protein [Thalassotalea hakodatensis]|uniref:hypothetical protein n=1 Tax=Thalassotalea hakodatensis TaxID=3030492 RepID=UPI002572E88B|nr:hypothetical protein [Thalassotalea hakodatensis]
MKITNAETLKQALASMRLEGLSLSPEVNTLMLNALVDPNIDTEDIKRLLVKPYRNAKEKRDGH